MPDLPRGNYTLWVRGYGLTDSKPVPGRPGQQVNLQATIAATPRDAAAVYPANYWYSMIKVPDKSEFPGTGEKGNGISPNMRSAGRLDQPVEGRLPAVPPDGQPCDS